MATTPVQNPSPPSRESIESSFRRLESQWKADTQFLSDPSKIMAHPAMRAIIALGDDVVPIILRDLQVKSSLLVWALPEITGNDICPPRIEDGFRKWDVNAQIKAWLQWGGDKGLV
jgi:hypothetical protein